MRHLLLVSLMSMCMGCASTQSSGLIDALGLWRSGKKTSSVTAARHEYQRFLQANGIAESDIRRTVQQTTAQLDTEPVITEDETLLPHPNPEWLTKEKFDPNELSTRLQSDLLSHSSVRVMKALMVVKSTLLTRHAVLVLHIIYDRVPMEPDNPLMDGLSQAHQTLTVKRFAMDTLEAL